MPTENALQTGLDDEVVMVMEQGLRCPRNGTILLALWAASTPTQAEPHRGSAYRLYPIEVAGRPLTATNVCPMSASQVLEGSRKAMFRRSARGGRYGGHSFRPTRVP